MKIKLILCLLLLSLAAGNAQAQKKKLTPTITYELTPDGTLIFEGTGEMPDFKYNNGFFKKKINNKPVKRIVIGEGISKIGDSTFRDYVGDNTIDVELPTSIKEIHFCAFSNTRVNIKLPEGVKLDWLCFDKSIVADRFEIPKGATIDIQGLSQCRIDTLVFNENVASTGANDSKYHRPSTKCLVFKGPAKIYESHLVNLESVETVIVENDNTVDVDLLRRGLPNAKIITPREMAIADAKDQGVYAYLECALPSWEEYLTQQTSGLRSPEQVKAQIAAQVEQWQKKGEFESTSQWQARVNEKTRSAMIKKLSQEYTSEMNAAVEKAKTQYAKIREAAVNEYFNEKKQARLKEIKSQPMTLRPYDADNQTFMISSPAFGDILLKVPLADAADFKNNWRHIASKADFEIVPVSEKEVGLSKITFYGAYPKEYVYDGSSKANYTMTEVNYNFSPVEISDADLAAISISDFQAPAAGTTVTTGSALKTGTAQVEKRTITAGNGNSRPAQPKAVQSAVDTNVPAGTGAPRTNTFALVIANENYNRTESVPYALHDGEVFKKYLTTTMKVPEKNVFMVKNATLNDIRYHLKKLSDVSHAFEGDADLIVYYAGHGVPDETTHDAYLLPVDGYPDDATSGMSLSEFTETLAALPSQRSVLLLDACFSGAGRQGDMLSHTRGVAIKARPTDGKGNLVVFSASQGTETAHPYHSEGHGLFTYFLLKKLSESKGNVTLGELTDYVITNVKRTSAVEGKIQTPSVNASAVNTAWKDLRL